MYLWPGYNGAVARFCVQYATQRRTPPTIPYRRQTTAPPGPTQPAPRTPAAQTTASARLELTTIVPIKALAAMATIKSIRIRIPFLWTGPTMTETRLTHDLLHTQATTASFRKSAATIAENGYGTAAFGKCHNTLPCRKPVPLTPSTGGSRVRKILWLHGR